MPKIEEDFTSEQPDYDDKDEEELEGSDLDDMCLVDLCSSDDDDVSELVPVNFYPVIAIAKHTRVIHYLFHTFQNTSVLLMKSTAYSRPS